jgi:hypothetical protein
VQTLSGVKVALIQRGMARGWVEQHHNNAEKDEREWRLTDGGRDALAVSTVRRPRPAGQAVAGGMAPPAGL